LATGDTLNCVPALYQAGACSATGRGLFGRRVDTQHR
jgi:hypothetical protein